jgi:hypothetical protein
LGQLAHAGSEKWPLRALPILGLWKFAVKVRNRASASDVTGQDERPLRVESCPFRGEDAKVWYLP